MKETWAIEKYRRRGRRRRYIYFFFGIWYGNWKKINLHILGDSPRHRSLAKIIVIFSSFEIRSKSKWKKKNTHLWIWLNIYIIGEKKIFIFSEQFNDSMNFLFGSIDGINNPANSIKMFKILFFFHLLFMRINLPFSVSRDHWNVDMSLFNFRTFQIYGNRKKKIDISI